MKVKDDIVQYEGVEFFRRRTTITLLFWAFHNDRRISRMCAKAFNLSVIKIDNSTPSASIFGPNIFSPPLLWDGLFQIPGLNLVAYKTLQNNRKINNVKGAETISVAGLTIWIVSLISMNPNSPHRDHRSLGFRKQLCL